MRKLILPLFLFLVVNISTHAGGYTGDTFLAWSPEGDRLLFYTDCVALMVEQDQCETEAGVFLMVNDEIIQVLSDGQILNPDIRWSPDGRYFSASSGNGGNLFIGSRDGDLLYEYTDLPAGRNFVYWVGDEPHLVSDVEKGTDLNETILTLDEDQYISDRSPDSQWVTVTTPDSLILIDLMTGTRFEIDDLSSPLVWSPDSRWFIGFLGEEDKVMVRVEDGTVFPLPENTPFEFAWRDDAYVYSRGGTVHIVEGANQQEVTTDDNQISGIVWSPDSQHLAWTATRDEATSICIFTRETEELFCSAPYPLGESRYNSPHTHQWSPDSSMLVSIAYRGERAQRRAFLHFMLMEDETTREYAILNESSAPPLSVAWSPDGAKLAFLPIEDEEPLKILNRDAIMNLPQ
jgi:dipeptidyl aminopeptidase/acylaminoacyl peptidase